MDSPDLPEPHPGDPWHPAWDAETAAADDEHALAAEAAARVHEIVRRLDADEEMRVGLEAAAAGRRMLEQIAGVRDGASSALVAGFTPSDDPVDVAPSEGGAVPESAGAPRRRRLGRLRRSASRTGSAVGGDEQEVTNVVDEPRDDERTEALSAGSDDESPGSAEDVSAEAGSPSASDGGIQPELGDEEDFPWDDEDWSAARAGDDPDTTRELDLVTPDTGRASQAELDVDEVEQLEDDQIDADEVDEDLPEQLDEDLEADEPVEEEPVIEEPNDVGSPLESEVELVAETVDVGSDTDEPDAVRDEESAPEVGEALDVASVEDERDAAPADIEVPEESVDEQVDEVAASAGDVESETEDEPELIEVEEIDADVTLELEAVSSEDDGVFTHAEVIPLVRAPQAHEATAGLDPDLLAIGEDQESNDPDSEGDDVPEAGAADDAGLDEDADASPDDASDSSDEMDEFAAFTLEDYTGTATEEYAELARAVAASEDEALELAAISAEMPGLDTSLVGLDDVVEAGIGVTETLSTTRRSDLGLRVATAVGLLIVFFGSLLWPWAIGGLILVVLGVAALELYIVTVNAGYRPLTWAGLVGVVGALAGTWVWGVVAIPIALALTAIGATLFLALSAERRTPLLDLALTIAMMAWVGVLGAPAFEIVEAQEYRWLILAVVLTTAFMDVAQYFVGRAIGRRKLAPVVSPKKTIEGLVGGVFTALIVGVVFGSIEASPFDPGSGLAFGAVVAVVAPLGDLAVSVVKRALGVKDMSAILPGHGGIMDRIDAMVFVIPSAWIVFRYFDLLG